MSYLWLIGWNEVISKLKQVYAATSKTIDKKTDVKNY